jgi:DNA-binding NarL/FixJ family response regulator
MRWFGERMHGQPKRKYLLHFRQALGERTPEQIAENLRTSDLAERIPTSDVTKLAQDIAGLNEFDQYLLACTGEGKSQEELARELFIAPQTVKLHLDQIVERLRSEGGEN